MFLFCLLCKAHTLSVNISGVAAGSGACTVSELILRKSSLLSSEVSFLMTRSFSKH
jgi:hypothetical protein